MELLITSEHLRETKRRFGGYCTRGLDQWFQRYGMSLREFLQHGYPVSRIEATGDALGLRVVGVAREMEASK